MKAQVERQSTGKRSLKARLGRLAPFFLVGPISGPLLAGVVFNFKDGRPVLAGLYAFALVEYTFLLPALVVKLGLRLH